MRVESPVVFIIFNRPQTTMTVFKAIAAAEPKMLLVVADGPRFPDEARQCEKTREIIRGVNWRCEVMQNFSSQNLGCGSRVSTGLDWAFSLVDEAIVLEDDCIPAPSFFPFCETLLRRFKDDERVMHINGNNFQFGVKRTRHSYYFSKYPHIWGWATWRRAWKHYDFQMRTWPEFKKTGMIDLVCDDPLESHYWQNNFDDAHSGRIDTWDYQWIYTCWSQGSLSVTPGSNLVSNIGFGTSATHTHGTSPLAALPREDIWELSHPDFLVRHRAADLYTFDQVFGGKYMREGNRLRSAIRKVTSSLGKGSFIRHENRQRKTK
jgi:hypothetical protein